MGHGTPDPGCYVCVGSWFVLKVNVKGNREHFNIPVYKWVLQAVLDVTLLIVQVVVVFKTINIHQTAG
jgi:hypothetical protein